MTRNPRPEVLSEKSERGEYINKTKVFVALDTQEVIWKHGCYTETVSQTLGPDGGYGVTEYERTWLKELKAMGHMARRFPE